MLKAACVCVTKQAERRGDERGRCERRNEGIGQGNHTNITGQGYSSYASRQSDVISEEQIFEKSCISALHRLLFDDINRNSDVRTNCLSAGVRS